MASIETQSESAMFHPVVKQLPDEFDVAHCVERLSQLPHFLSLESSMRHEKLGRYSYLMADPVDWLTPASIAELRTSIQNYRAETIESAPPFQGGLAGLVSYEYNRTLESIPDNRFRDFPVPQLAFGLYDVVVAFDHFAGKAWLISQGFCNQQTESKDESLAPMSRRNEFAEQRANWFMSVLTSSAPSIPELDTCSPSSFEELAPQFPVPGPEGLTSNFSKEQYLAAAQKCIDYIYAGDVFQINLSQRLLMPSNCSPSTLYQRLRQCNPATFSGYFDLGDAQIISASPERFISVQGTTIETRPIKGTRRRTRFPQIDLTVAQQLLTSEKDRAENIMIVDLMRNDLSQICTDDSVKVTQLCELETYESVFHLVSAVTGELNPGVDVFTALDMTFPGGSITGAPKIRAMEIIAELEPTSRGAYCGSLGYIGINGNADFNILIRTITACRGWWQVPVGGGLVAQSDPLHEYEETWTKAAAMLTAISRKQET